MQKKVAVCSERAYVIRRKGPGGAGGREKEKARTQRGESRGTARKEKERQTKGDEENEQRDKTQLSDSRAIPEDGSRLPDGDPLGR